MTVSSCGHDERGKYSGGEAGDQDGTEYRVRSWYDGGWDCVLRHPDRAIGKDIATLAKQAAQNGRIGYDQSQRLTFWQQLKKATSYLPKNVKSKCEADCSSSTAAIVKAVGYRKGDAKLQGVSPECWTGNLRQALQNAGFEVLTGSRYTESAAWLLPGDILLNEEHHVVVNLTRGSKAGTAKAKAAEPAKAGKLYRVTAKSGLNYRRAPGTANAAMGAYEHGAEVEVVATRAVGGETWGQGTNGYWSLMRWMEEA